MDKYKKLSRALAAILVFVLTAFPGINVYAQADDEKNSSAVFLFAQSSERKENSSDKKAVYTGIKSIKFAAGKSCKIGRGETAKLRILDQNGKTVGGNISFSSSDKKILTVDSRGNVKGKKLGKARVTAKTGNGKRAVCEVTVKNPVKSIKLNITSAKTGVGEKNINIDSFAFGGYAKVRKYRSLNTKVASVNGDGIVTGIRPGTATIVCSTYNGKKASCKITVGNAPESVRITNSNNIIQKNANNHKIHVKLSPGAYSYKLTYSVKDKKIAQVNSKGCITGKKCGKTTVTVKTYNGFSASQEIVVKNDSLSLNVNSAQLALDRKNVEKIKYGTSVQGRNLEAFVISNEANKGKEKVLLMDFAMHGFEDAYNRDGKVLVNEANAIINYFASHSSELKGYKLVVIPCVNPDGTIAGKNNKRACKSAFGRCTAKHIDINRDFGKFKAVESRRLKSFILETEPDIYLNMHGWYNETVGSKRLNSVINKQLGLSGRSDGYMSGSGYAITWVHNVLGIPASLVEYKSPKSVSLKKDVKMIKEIIK